MGKKSQITCITYRAHAPSDWKVILKRENKPKPVYLGTSVSIFCLLWAGVGDSHKSEGRKDLRHCSAGEISNCTVNRDTREKRGQESNGAFNQPCCLAYVLSFYRLFLPLSVFLREHWLCECSITERDLCGFQGRKEDTGGFLSEWIYLRRGINIMLVWPWLNLQFQILETFVCNRVSILFSQIFLSHIFWVIKSLRGEEGNLCTKHSALYIGAKCKRDAWQANREYCRVHSKLLIAFKPLLSTSLHINKILLTSFLEFDKKKITRLPCKNS